MQLASFFFNDTATSEIYTLSLHDALPIYRPERAGHPRRPAAFHRGPLGLQLADQRGFVGQRRAAGGSHPRKMDRGITDRKSTRLNSSHANISYAVFCLKKKTKRSYTCREL